MPSSVHVGERGRRRPFAVVFSPRPAARFRPSDAGSIPTTHTGSIHSLRSALYDEIRPDVPRADDGGANFGRFHAALPRVRTLRRTAPRPSRCPRRSTRISSPGFTGSSGTSEPGEDDLARAERGPVARRACWRATRRRRAESPAPRRPPRCSTTSPFFSTTIPHVTKSTRARVDLARAPRTKSPLEALSATVSSILIFHSCDPRIDDLEARPSRSRSRRGRPPA